ncbi:O-acetyltransferase OatA [BD1-7 clade bacterium]|uniref:O-acetyltransferase OatA n=1 Tax=BD1-7 clade bacterium TaxID=2029982 RepID=A0A5S9QGF7_9GAMM|nr:O-acetyltransferase OatA [BD1-7 clade bacterium]CAA0117085.1 O-acetyltransferase OatA [BD1-7 clade bacterium]
MIDWPWARSTDAPRRIDWMAIRQCFSVRENWHSLLQQDTQRNAALDGLRAAAVLYLLFYHAFHLVFLFAVPDDQSQFLMQLSVWLQPLVMGDRSVDAFFVLSGFLVSDLLMREYQRHGSIELWRFLRRRFWRLSPLYYCLILVFVVFAVPWVETRYYLANVLYLNNILPLNHQYIPFTWSLAIEEQFYCLLAIFFALGFLHWRRRFLVLLGLFVGSAAIRLAYLYLHPELLVQPDQLLVVSSPVREGFAEQLYTSTWMRIGPLIAGVLLAYCVRFHGRLMQQIAGARGGIFMLMALAVVLVLANFVPLFGRDYPQLSLLLMIGLHRHVLAVAVMLMMLLALYPARYSRWFSNFCSFNGFAPIAKLGFALYLGHLPVMMGVYIQMLDWGWLDSQLTLANAAALLLIASPFFLSGSILVYILIEKPFLRLRDVKLVVKG